MNRLAGKYAFVTGASQGLGRQLAIDFAREGVAGVALVARNADALREVQQRSGDKPFRSIDEVMSRSEMEDLLSRYRQVTGNMR